MRKSQPHFHNLPTYRGGAEELDKFIANNLSYPDEAFASGVEGDVHIKYDVNHLGMIVKLVIMTGIGHGCNEEALRLVKLLRYQGARNAGGVKVMGHYDIVIHFRLSKWKEKLERITGENSVPDVDFPDISDSKKIEPFSL